MESNQIKLLLLGEENFGKTALYNKLRDGSFTEEYIPTIGIDFQIKNIAIDGVPTKIQIWDASGQQRFRSIVARYHRGTHWLILVFDMSNRNTFDNLEHHYQQFIDLDKVHVQKLLLGNKWDLVDYQVCDAEAQVWALARGMKFHMTSVKTNDDQFQQTYELVIDAINYRIHSDKVLDKPNKIDLQNQASKIPSSLSCQSWGSIPQFEWLWKDPPVSICKNCIEDHVNSSVSNHQLVPYRRRSQQISDYFNSIENKTKKLKQKILDDWVRKSLVFLNSFGEFYKEFMTQSKEMFEEYETNVSNIQKDAHQALTQDIYINDHTNFWRSLNRKGIFEYLKTHMKNEYQHIEIDQEYLKAEIRNMFSQIILELEDEELNLGLRISIDKFDF